VAEAGGQLAGGQGAAHEDSRHAQSEEAQAFRRQGLVIPEAAAEPDGGNRSVPVVAGSGRLPVDQLLKWTGFCQQLMNPDRHGFWGRFVKSLQDTASRRFSVAFHGLGNGRRLC